MKDIIDILCGRIAKQNIKTYDELINAIAESKEFEVLNDWYIMLLLEHFIEYDFVKERIGEMKSGIIKRAKNCRRNER